MAFNRWGWAIDEQVRLKQVAERTVRRMKAVDEAALAKNALPKYNTKLKNAKKKAKQKKRGKSEIDAGNIIEDAPEPHKPEPVVFTIPDAEQQSAPSIKTGGTKKLKQKTARNLPIGARVKIKTTRFDTYAGSWSNGRPEYTFGTIVEKKSGGIMGVRWDGGEDVWDSHWKHLQSTPTDWRFVQQDGDPSNKTALAITRVCYVSWQEVEETYDAQDDQKDGSDTPDVTKESTSIQFAYTMGSMSIKGYQTDTDNPGWDSDAQSNEVTELAINFAF